MAIQPFDLCQIAATPWKNGGGATREIACWPPGADMEHFNWRVSVATIASSGPFSRFVGVDRVIALLSGDGVHLRQPQAGIDHFLQRPLQPFAFAGDVGMECDLLGGTSTDFNLMTRRDRWKGELQVLTGSTVLHSEPAGLFLAVLGCWTVTSLGAAQGQPIALAPEAGLWWADENFGWSATPENSSGDVALLHVQLKPALRT
jgi:hypothetical protein